MVLIVESHIISEKVQWTVVAECLRDLRVRERISSGYSLSLENVVFGDEVTCAGMKTASEERGEDKVV